MSDPGADPRLVVPEGLVIDESTRERLARQLDDAPPSVSGIGAETMALEPGASCRVKVEWTALDTPWSSASAPGAGVRSVGGAVLVRPGVAYAVRDGRVEVAAGTVLVDPGACVHDPDRAAGPLLVASDRGRSPFPRRPVVLFLACEPPDAADADRVRRLVNRLVRRGVEARIAVPAPPAGTPESSAAAWVAGPQLTRACLADGASVRALAPDVVVTLDGTAAAQADGWLAGNRGAVVVAYDPTLADPMELVSWQIGHAAGRLRARIGPFVDVPAFASLVVRLCAGPQPEPPAAEPELLHVRTRVREHWNTDPAADRAAGCVIVAGALDTADAARIEGLVDSLEGAGVPVLASAFPGVLPTAASTAPLVLFAGVAPDPELHELVVARGRVGLPTVLDLVRADVASRSGARPGARLTGAAAEFADAGVPLVAAPGARATAARAAGARTLVVPTLIPRAQAAELRDARVPLEPGAPRVVGWFLPPATDAALYAAPVAAALVRALADRRDRLECVGDPEALPAALRGHERVMVVPGAEFALDAIAGWAVHVWTPALAGDEKLDDARVFEAVSCAAVPSVVPAVALAGLDGTVSPHLVVQDVDDAEEWYDALERLLGNPAVRAGRADEARRRADALNTVTAAQAVAGRLMGWAAYRSTVSV